LSCPWKLFTSIRSKLWEGHSFMMHITCDLCGKEVSSGDDPRFVVKIEVFAAHDPTEITEADLDEDHMEVISQLLLEMEDNPDEELELAPTCKKFRYDLCPECQKKFVRDPLGKEGSQKFDFSEN
jgi:endogenous inhibitor of DNA gyrase (YacG/DUF329 family)